MPTYDYVCRACGHEMELFQSMTEGAKRKCPECGEPRLKRLIGTGAGLIFKGSGFYETDYRSKSYKDAEKADKKPTEPKEDRSKPSSKKPEAGKSDSQGEGKGSKEKD